MGVSTLQKHPRNSRKTLEMPRMKKSENFNDVEMTKIEKMDL